jgi:hypothetical protein
MLYILGFYRFCCPSVFYFFVIISLLFQLCQKQGHTVCSALIPHPPYPRSSCWQVQIYYLAPSPSLYWLVGSASPPLPPSPSLSLASRLSFTTPASITLCHLLVGPAHHPCLHPLRSHLLVGSASPPMPPSPSLSLAGRLSFTTPASITLAHTCW